MNEFDKRFIDGFKAAMDSLECAIYNLGVYEGFYDAGVFYYFLNNIKIEDINDEGEKYEASMMECLSNALNDWITRDLNRFIEECEEECEEENYGECQDCIQGVPKDNGEYFCALHGIDMHKDNTCENYMERKIKE